MRIYYPANDTPIFTYSAISLSDYDWSLKTAWQRAWIYFFQSAWIVVFGYIFLVSAGHRLILWSDLSWAFVLAILKCVGVLALFPLIMFSLGYFLNTKYPERSRIMHKFYREWAAVYRRPAKGGGFERFFVERVECFELQRSVFQEEPVYLAKVRFKPLGWKILGRREAARFILCAADEVALGPLVHWAETNRIEVRFLKDEGNQRRS